LVVPETVTEIDLALSSFAMKAAVNLFISVVNVKDPSMVKVGTFSGEPVTPSAVIFMFSTVYDPAGLASIVINELLTATLLILFAYLTASSLPSSEILIVRVTENVWVAVVARNDADSAGIGEGLSATVVEKSKLTLLTLKSKDVASLILSQLISDTIAHVSVIKIIFFMMINNYELKL